MRRRLASIAGQLWTCGEKAGAARPTGSLPSRLTDPRSADTPRAHVRAGNAAATPANTRQGKIHHRRAAFLRIEGYSSNSRLIVPVLEIPG